ncbi:amidohydrolase family protein [Nocardia jiangxiensis]|uniref:6-methylsalicylate decarboxylase n=1 Tax=Nocardia jiangxiensis TaxID=282685 RepID=A0ABW6RZ12_9NOCA
MPLIDTHTHYFPSRLIHGLARRSDSPSVENEDGVRYVRYGRYQRFPLRSAMTDIDAKISEMDRFGIDVSILSVTMPGVDGLGADAIQVAGETNDELAEITSCHAHRLGWVALLPMDEPEAAGTELRRAVAMGARGAMIYSNVAGRPLDLDIDAPVFEAACELDVPILLHPTLPLTAMTLQEFELTSTLGYLFDTTTAALRLTLGGLFTRYPDLKFVVCHAGSLLPYQSGRIDYQAMNRPGGHGPITAAKPSEDLRKLYTDSVCLSPATLRFVVDFFSASHVMAGTDHPQWPIGDGLETLAATELTDAERSAITYRTAAQLFNLPLAEPAASTTTSAAAD